GKERDELEEYPEEETEELALIYAARGVPQEDARKLAATLMADPTRALDTLAREELGLNPDELGSPLGAAFFSFLSFAIGALIPLAPFLFTAGTTALLVAIALAAVALFAVGAALSLFSGRSSWWGGGRMLLIGAAAGAASYGIGTLFGVATAWPALRASVRPGGYDPCMIVKISSAGVSGIMAGPVDVEVDGASTNSTDPAFMVVGLPDKSNSEARERVRAAIDNAGYDWPFLRLTVNLAP